MKQSLIGRLSQQLELEGEPLPGRSLIEIAGEDRILVENHLGVCEYSRERIGVNLKFGRAEVCGEGLELACMTREQLVITGCIHGVSLHRRAHK